MAEFKNEEVVVKPGETIPNICYDRIFPVESKFIHDQIVDAANNFAAAVQRQLKDFCEHNQMYNFNKGIRIDIMLNKNGYKCYVADVLKENKNG